MRTVRRSLTAAALAVGLTVGAAGVATAAPAPAAQAAPLVVPALAADVFWDYSDLFPTAVIVFTQYETRAVVNAGIAGAGVTAAGHVSNPLLKGAIAAASMLFWYAANDALNNSPCGRLMVEINLVGGVWFGHACGGGGTGSFAHLEVYLVASVVGFDRPLSVGLAVEAVAFGLIMFIVPLLGSRLRKRLDRQRV
jgi:hypothetical protein